MTEKNGTYYPLIDVAQLTTVEYGLRELRFFLSGGTAPIFPVFSFCVNDLMIERLIHLLKSGRHVKSNLKVDLLDSVITIEAQVPRLTDGE